MKRERILFVTGRLAEPALRRVLEPLAKQAGFEHEVAVLGISVAALMHAHWVLRKLEIREPFDRVILPGWCQGDLQPLRDGYGVPIELGPKDLFDLPEFFGNRRREPVDLSRYEIEILAEINHAPRMTDEAILREAEHYRTSGADVIDLGCVPGESWGRTGEVTRLLRDQGHRVSIDSFDRQEVETAVAAGAELVLSCNGTNLDWLPKLGVEVVAIPDDPHDLNTLEPALDVLAREGTPFRIDPVLEPIGFGFAASLAHYYEARRRWPQARMMMGIGNLTELTEVDSAGVNMVLAALCEELCIRSVLTTEVINWARSAVREFDLARRLVYHAVTEGVLPKRLEPDLVTFRDPRLYEVSEEGLRQLARDVTDRNYRLFAERGEIHVINGSMYLRGTDPFVLFEEMRRRDPKVDPSHAFYLGYEMAKAVTALTLGKNYEQDQALRWGFLTVPEVSHRNTGADGKAT